MRIRISQPTISHAVNWPLLSNRCPRLRESLQMRPGQSGLQPPCAFYSFNCAYKVQFDFSSGSNIPAATKSEYLSFLIDGRGRARAGAGGPRAGRRWGAGGAGSGVRAGGRIIACHEKFQHHFRSGNLMRIMIRMAAKRSQFLRCQQPICLRNIKKFASR